LTRLFSEDACVRIEGLSVVLNGRREIAGPGRYAVTVRSHMDILSWATDGDTVVCRLTGVNEWFRLLGVDSVGYRARFVVCSGRITFASFDPARASEEALAVRLAEFGQWLVAVDP
jgi:hypothetical protein